MRLIASDPDIQTIIARIHSGVLDLQPDFQRGEVWSLIKKKRLIDSILRDWHIPPIHVVVVEGRATQEVLDGQQRLVAIRDFVAGDFAIDGEIQPHDAAIANLHGLKYSDLPAETRNTFDQFTVRIFRLVDYRPDEPGELFFRLNQLTSLTAAEQRNAFYGPVREQVKQLVREIEIFPTSTALVGFSNARMSFDDTVAKLLCTYEKGSLAAKITAGAISDRFRSQEPFPFAWVKRARDAIHVLLEAKEQTSTAPRFNKATFFSWLLFCGTIAARPLDDRSIRIVAKFLSSFEELRLNSSLGFLFDDDDIKQKRANYLIQLFEIYEDRASSRVADVSSVIYRDFILWFLFRENSHSDEYDILVPPRRKRIIENCRYALLAHPNESAEEVLSSEIDFLEWGLVE